MVYEHGADGQALSGSIDVLREVLMRNAPSFRAFCRRVDPDSCSKPAQAVRDGLTIKVGLLSLSALSGVDSTRGGAEADGSISYLPSLQPLIQSDGAVEMNCDASLVRIPPHTTTTTTTTHTS